MRSPHTLQLVMDSLRWWATEVHVDGFRFDLASTLARSLHEVDRLSAFFDIVQQDPVISQVKLIAEPWDVGEGGYQVGNFPPQWAEWNGRYRDDVRDFWRGAQVGVGRARPAPHRLVGPLRVRRPPPPRLDQLRHGPRRVHAGRPHQLRRTPQRGQRRGQRRTARGSTGPGTAASRDRPTIRRCSPLRRRQRRNLLTTLLLSQGVPMLLGGDELGRTPGRQQQRATARTTRCPGTTGTAVDEDLLAFTRRLVAYRQTHPVFRRRRFFQGRPIRDPRGQRGAARHRVVRSRRRRDDRRAVGGGRRPRAHRVPQRRPRGDRPPRRAGGGRPAPADPQRRSRATVTVTLPPAAPTRSAWAIDIDTDDRKQIRTGTSPPRRRPSTSRGAACSSCGPSMADRVATYRWQLTPTEGFAVAAAAVARRSPRSG